MRLLRGWDLTWPTGRFFFWDHGWTGHKSGLSRNYSINAPPASQQSKAGLGSHQCGATSAQSTRARCGIGFHFWESSDGQGPDFDLRFVRKETQWNMNLMNYE